jgi:hypothetical protein
MPYQLFKVKHVKKKRRDEDRSDMLKKDERIK